MKKSVLFLLSFAFIAVSCDKDDDDTTTTTSNNSTLSLDISNLTPVETNERYEGWVIVDGSPVSTGLFTVSEQGDLSQANLISQLLH